ncbi:glycosyltransferase family 39 protein [Candidatus Daviesbacteria bacterium]|nr:glycosyltransferase family 39 protein [Candidatus Daviesbacteria bacterium]
MKKVLLIPLIIIVLVLPTLLPLFNERFFYTQDYIFIARLQQMSTALSSGQFPVRWAPDLRYGEPLFNFYAPLPYYIGSAIHLLGFNFIWVAKILFILSSLLSAATMYLLANKLFGRKAGLLAATLYTYAPYRAVDMYVRGSLSETWAFVFFPLIFYASILLSQKETLKNISLVALSLAGLFLTHNVTTLMFLPFLGLWWIYLILRERKLKIVLYLSLASILGFGIAAFFLLPAFFENGFIQTKYLTVGYFNFRAHFVAYKQFLSLFWGYGSSVWGPTDGLSFQIGLANLTVLAAAAILAVLHRTEKKLLGLFSLLGISFVLSIFLQHNKSAFIWEAIPEMAFIQFPWRFLGISVFIIALTGGAVAVYLKKRLLPFYFILIIAGTISTLMYFKPKEYSDNSFFDKFLQIEMMHRGVDLTKDYLPIWVQNTDGERFDEPRANEGEILVSSLKRNSTSLSFSADVLSKSLIEVPISYFPGWQVKAGNQDVSILPPSNTGLIRFKLPEGAYKVRVELVDTPIRTVGNIISVASILLVFFMLLKFFPKKKAL